MQAVGARAEEEGVGVWVGQCSNGTLKSTEAWERCGGHWHRDRDGGSEGRLVTHKIADF